MSHCGDVAVLVVVCFLIQGIMQCFWISRGMLQKREKNNPLGIVQEMGHIIRMHQMTLLFYNTFDSFAELDITFPLFSTFSSHFSPERTIVVESILSLSLFPVLLS